MLLFRSTPEEALNKSQIKTTKDFSKKIPFRVKTVKGKHVIIQRGNAAKVMKRKYGCTQVFTKSRAHALWEAPPASELGPTE